MRLNIFSIPPDQVEELAAKLENRGLESVQSLDQNGWAGDFLFSASPAPSRIPWISTFSEFFEGQKFFNISYSAVILLKNEQSCFALTFGKSHFYVRPHCDYDFGIELAKRIADEGDITQTAARRYQGKQKKDIRSFTDRARLNIPPGESVDFLQASVMTSKVDDYGKVGKFGASALLTPPVVPAAIGGFLTMLSSDLANDENFRLPRTVVLSDQDEIARYDEKLLDELQAPVGTTDIATNTFDLFGVDFVFSSAGSFTLKCGHYKPLDLDQLTMKDVKEYITSRAITREKLLKLRIVHRREGSPEFSQMIKESLDFISDEDRVVLSGGKWLKFNQDYLDYLDESIRQIRVEETEPDFAEISQTESDFNLNLVNFGYEVADKDFSVLQTSSVTPVEAWDLRKGDTVYAVKFGTPQKLNYVCDQAMNVLELIHNRAAVREIPGFERYCLWLGYRAKKQPMNLAESGSIILKQKVDAWARRCEEIGIVPVLKLSRKISVKYDTPADDV